MTELYLYQTVHLARGHARNVAAHIAVLDAAAHELFGRRYAPGAAQLAERIEALAAAERYPTGVSLYDGYAFRSLTPEAVTLCYELPLTEAPTSAREAAAQLARRMAGQAGAETAVRCDRDGILRDADNAPLFAVTGHTVLAAPGAESVERELTVRAVQAAGLELREEPFGRGDLRRIDELFFADHRGITALARCDGQPLMTLVAERIATAAEGLFLKK